MHHTCYTAKYYHCFKCFISNVKQVLFAMGIN